MSARFRKESGGFLLIFLNKTCVVNNYYYICSEFINKPGGNTLIIN